MDFWWNVEENGLVRNCAFVNSLRRNHTAHHNGRLMMEVNMNLTFPIADWLFGTSDLNRGLLGHLFNGYDTRHLKQKLRGTPKRPDDAAAVPVGNYYRACDQTVTPLAFHLLPAARSSHASRRSNHRLS